MPEKIVVVNLGEIYVTNDPTVIISCVGLGSCVAICAYDPAAKVGGMAHVVLPTSNGNGNATAKFANIAVPLLVEKMLDMGALRIRMVVKITGGARMGILDNHVANSIGAKNAQAVMASLSSQNVKLAASEVGGTHGRSVRMDMATGTVIVKTIGSVGHKL